MLRRLDISRLSYIGFCDATSSRQLLMTVGLYYIIDVSPNKKLLRVYLYLSKYRFSLYITSKRKRKAYLKDLAKY